MDKDNGADWSSYNGDKKRQRKPSLACNLDGATDINVVSHPMESYSIWNSLPQQDKESKVKCLKRPFGTDLNTSDCNIKGRACKNCGKDSHHFLLCPAKKAMTGSNMAKNKLASSCAG